MWKFTCAVFTRALFILVSLIGVFRVTRATQENNYWFLTLLFLPQVAEMVITLKMRRGQDYKWYSPAILLFLISIIPSMWILELQQNMSAEQECFCFTLITIIHGTFKDYIEGSLKHLDSAVCSKEWILTLHMILLILLILGKWLLPIGGGVTKDELSQLLLIFVGTAADILEFTTETSVLVDRHGMLRYIVLAVWTWSMLQFPLHLSVVNTKPEEEGEQGGSLMARHSTNLWTIVQALFIQDGPFLVVRLIVMSYFNVFDQMLVFYAIKNTLVVVLNMYRLIVICQDYRSTDD